MSKLRENAFKNRSDAERSPSLATLIIGDVHLKSSRILPTVDEILEDNRDINRLVFTGDICDEWHSSDRTFEYDLRYFEEWVRTKRVDGYTVDAVYGNHDFQYLFRTEGPGTHPSMYGFVIDLLASLDFRMAHVVDGMLVTHAGLTNAWTSKYLGDITSAQDAADQLNTMFDDLDENTMRALYSAGAGRGGVDIPGPLWADKDELKLDAVPYFDQIVGHTPVYTVLDEKSLRVDEGDATTLWFCDTFSLTPWMLQIGDGTMIKVTNGKVTIV